MLDFDAVVVGAGVIGLATARALALSGRSVLLVEQADSFGTETSSRNSEVIHAGIYYPEGSLKARLCVEGRHRLYAFLAERGIAHRRCGKLLVAVEEEEMAKVAALCRQAEANGVDDIRMIGAEEARVIEPALATVGGAISPSTGIFDSHAYMLALMGDAENSGATIVFRAPFLGAERSSDGTFRIRVGGGEETVVEAAILVNAAGLRAAEVAAAIADLDPVHVPKISYAKGNYFSLGTSSPFNHLVYPMPNSASLGVHLTLDLAGNARFGPDAEWIEAIDYDVDPARADLFYAAIRRYWPGLPDHSLIPGYAGIRPKLVHANEAAADFRIDGMETHGIDGLVNLFGIESPGLTSSLAIAEEVLTRVGEV
ncbi:NAD(P)/FAD-dependent oxidoreductase [Propylenella binzhouense]|uniref:NAD(P)/FAD-dependent oxidoreductase n=1 Tax=Propylenella binzhouense TaxID=2555902 RepID=A0A964T896_9HYPH|nr:NAD(P)/FAD-dependent oxidoreductase [Propylenella binzhouense]MYZ49167.1 NAD(P)/FAD-dependent oxidoreductase [Propylenella binzhouense]